ncbi:MAG: TldD/PmbA family protein [candidate division Zixibacteria bacterium]|nr:TldD/PmbA family protein [candidate division Zixibacteria bacterium]
MIGKEKLFSTFEKVVKSSRADETEIVYIGTNNGLTRFANSTIHQNVNESNATIYIRTVIGQKIGVSSTNSMNQNDLKAAIANSFEIAKYQKDNEYFPGLPGPEEYPEIETYFEPTAKYSPKDRARQVKKVFVRANKRKFLTAGSFATGDGEIAVFNTKGVRCHQALTTANLQIIAMSDTSSGYSVGLSRKVEDIDTVALADIAVDKAFKSKKPKSVEAGDYEVILDPAATAALFEWVNYIGFGSKAFIDKTSFLSGNIGKKLIDDSVSIYDDAINTDAIAMPFDFEGVPKKKIYMIKNGIGKSAAYDRNTGNREGVPSTGHGLTADEHGEGGIPLNLFIAPGDKNREEMIASVKKGILVTRFHYINGFIDTPKAVLTGMTRDGTFLIEDGKIKHGIRNLRFTDSMIRTFSNVKGISAKTDLIPSWWDSVGCISAPTVHLGSFKFTGTTDF